jgi:cytochrome c oxidase subunit 4
MAETGDSRRHAEHGHESQGNAAAPASHSNHTAAPSTYFAVFGALLALTGLTVGASYLPLGNSPAIVHTLIAMAIAAVKASLVLLFFMHLWHSPRLTWLVAFGSLLWLAIMMVLTWADYWSRDWLGQSTALPSRGP